MGVSMLATVLQLDPRDNVFVALVDLLPGTFVQSDWASCAVTELIPAKHKMALVDLAPDDLVLMYGMVVGQATEPISRGGLISTRNIRHRAARYTTARQLSAVAAPNASPWIGLPDLNGMVRRLIFPGKREIVK